MSAILRAAETDPVIATLVAYILGCGLQLIVLLVVAVSLAARSANKGKE